MTNETPENTKGNVLFVDDDKFLADMYGMKFSAAQYTVHACLSVADALETLRGGFPADAIVFDVIMPGQDGFALLETIKKENLAPHARLIALTNQSNDADREKAESLGADRYVIKASMIPSEIMKVVAEEIANKK